MADPTATVEDPFASERRDLERVRDALVEQDLVVALGEWQADQLFGDPLLGRLSRDVRAAEGALLAAVVILDRAIANLLPVEQDEVWPPLVCPSCETVGEIWQDLGGTVGCGACPWRYDPEEDDRG